jgi:25S rRNA (adenine2142-N1)-methyltransferase
MPKTRKRKAPITSTDTASNSSSTPQSSRTLIRQFHVLLKRKAQLQNSRDGANAKDLADVERKLGELGGLSAYQRMSSIGQGSDRGGGSEKVLIGWLKELGMSKRGGHGKLRYVLFLSFNLKR